jgi:hypothetical protein
VAGDTIEADALHGKEPRYMGRVTGLITTVRRSELKPQAALQERTAIRRASDWLRAEASSKVETGITMAVAGVVDGMAVAEAAQLEGMAHRAEVDRPTQAI